MMNSIAEREHGSPAVDVPTGRRRVVIEGVEPQIDCGQYPIKRTVDEPVVVEADIFTDGHDGVAARVLFRKQGEDGWRETPMKPLGNDRFRGSFLVRELGRYQYTAHGWLDQFNTWRRDLQKRLDAGQDVLIDLKIGANMIEAAAERAEEADSHLLRTWAERLRDPSPLEEVLELAVSGEVAEMMDRYPDRRYAAEFEKTLEVVVDRERARFSAWYEFFPRSASVSPGRHGTLKDAEAWLPYVASMGFDIVYLPPIHPVGRAYRKGKNNAPVAEEGDVGSPWGIGAEEGGHKSIHPDLGTLEDFQDFVAAAKSHNLEVALDIAFQCSPDHPYVKEHPEWFRKRPDGTIQYAENPPKKYQDIYPIFFENENWRELWEELTSVVEYWAEQGVRVFRVDNPHTKPFHFWEYLIGRVKEQYPETIFLSEAFTRPKVMYRLAKLGFTQSYTYYAWRNTKYELTEYMTELTRTQVREFFRPNFWPNTPDILTEYLQFGGRPAFMIRLLLAATLTANYGMYGPAFEQMIAAPRDPGSEEYLDSEKYQIRHWDLDHPESLRPLITRVNEIRRANTALHFNEHLRFHPVDNEQIICYSKHSPDGRNAIVAVVNLDPYHTQTGWVELPLEALGLDQSHPYQVHDLLGDARYLWHGSRNYVELNPHVMPGHIFQIRRRVRTEQNFEYYL